MLSARIVGSLLLRRINMARLVNIRPPTLKGCVLLWFPFRNGKVAAQEPKSPVFPLAA